MAPINFLKLALLLASFQQIHCKDVDLEQDFVQYIQSYYLIKNQFVNTLEKNADIARMPNISQTCNDQVKLFINDLKGKPTWSLKG